jgi:hypothetical protein
LIGEGLNWLIFDEAAKCKHSVWEQALQPTLTDRDGRVLFITTPEGYNWIYDLWKLGNNPDYPEWGSLKFPSWENPHLDPKKIEEARRTMSESTFLQEYGADFTTTSGQVFKEFSESIHIVPHSELKLHKDWRRFRSIDFGYENPFVCLYLAIDEEDRIYLYKEYVRRHRTIEAHANHLNVEARKSFPKHLRPYAYTTCDPSGASSRATLLEKGIPTIGIRGDIPHGLEAVRQQLRVRDDGKPGFYVSSNCVETIKEFNLYCYPETGELENPKKEMDHCMDALRYFIVNWRRGHIRDLKPRYR